MQIRSLPDIRVLFHAMRATRRLKKLCLVSFLTNNGAALNFIVFRLATCTIWYRQKAGRLLMNPESPRQRA